ncbi:hypothetical protein VTG60DRAFT_4519 [Thermothelomyces hinnuleus]
MNPTYPYYLAAIEELESLLREANLRGKAQEAATPGFDLGPSPSFDSDQFDLLVDPFTPPSVEQVPLMDLGTAGHPPYSGGPLISLGLFEQLPSFDIIDDLTALYFQTIHDGAPMLHQGNYTLALRFPPPMRPPMCLQYIVMTLAAAMSDVYRHLSEPFYQRARVYAEADEMRAPGEIFATVAHAQCWCLIAAYECHVYAMYTRASTSLCRSVRIAQMLGLHRLDSQDPEPLRSGLPPPRNWTEAEERRRTWWTIFLADCYLTAVTGWPSLIDVRHIRTNLPSTEECFSTGMGGGGGGGGDLGDGLAASDHHHHPGGFPVLSFRGLVKSGPCTPSSAVVPSMLKAGTPRGLFSEIVPDPRGGKGGGKVSGLIWCPTSV